MNKADYSYSHTHIHRDKDWRVSQGLVKRCVITTAPLWAWLAICNSPWRYLPLLSLDSPAVSLSASLTGLTSSSLLPHHFPPPVLLPSVYEDLWGILLFPWQQPRSTLHPTLFLSPSSLSLPFFHTLAHSSQLLVPLKLRTRQNLASYRDCDW